MGYAEFDVKPTNPKALINYQQQETLNAGSISATATRQVFRAVKAGTLQSLYISTATGITANNTDYWTFEVKNKGSAGSGTTDMILTTAVNTTKATGGSGISAYIPRALTVHTTPANLSFVAGDLIAVTITKGASATTMDDFVLTFNFQDA